MRIRQNLRCRFVGTVQRAFAEESAGAAKEFGSSIHLAVAGEASQTAAGARKEFEPPTFMIALSPDTQWLNLVEVQWVDILR